MKCYLYEYLLHEYVVNIVSDNGPKGEVRKRLQEPLQALIADLAAMFAADICIFHRTKEFDIDDTFPEYLGIDGLN